MSYETTITPGPRPPARAAGPWAPACVAEVMDALWRAQREVPAWVLAEAAGARGAEEAPHDAGRGSAPAERTLLGERGSRLATLLAPRAVVLLGRAAGEVALPLVGAVLERAPVALVATLELADAPAREAAERLSARLSAMPADTAIVPVVANPTIGLALPRGAPHPRLYMAMGNVLGAFGTVGAVRLLRVVRATMGAHDRLLLGLDLRHNRGALEDEGHDDAGRIAERHLAVLGLLNRELGTDFDRARFAYRVVYDAAARRVDTLLVATREMRVACPRRGAFRLRKGESIRTAVDCKFDRARLAATLGGVGLRLDAWHEDAAGHAAIAVAAPGS